MNWGRVFCVNMFCCVLPFEGEEIVIGYRMDNEQIQVLFQNSSRANPASHSVGTEDSFPEFKAVRLGSKTLHIVVSFRMCVTVLLLLGESFK